MLHSDKSLFQFLKQQSVSQHDITDYSLRPQEYATNHQTKGNKKVKHNCFSHKQTLNGA